MRAAYVFPETLPTRNARGVQVVRTCAALAEQVDELRLYLARVSGTNDELFARYGIAQPANLKVIRLPRHIGPVVWSGRFNHGLRRHLLQWTKEVGACPVMTRHLQVAQALSASGLTTIFESHDFFHDKPDVRAKVRRLEQSVLASVDGVAFLTNGLRDRVLEKVKINGRTTVIPSGTDVGPSGGLVRKFDSRPVRDFVYAGSTRYHWKGVAVLLAAVDELVKQSDARDVPRLHLVGPIEGAVSQHESQVRRLVACGALELHGYVEPSAMPALLRTFEVAVLPNTEDSPNSALFTSPLKLLEYMATPIAVVASDLPSVREIAGTDEALLVSPGCPRALAEGIRRLLTDAPLRNRLSANALRRVQEFSWERRAAKFIDFLQHVARQPAGSIAG